MTSPAVQFNELVRFTHQNNMAAQSRETDLRPTDQPREGMTDKIHLRGKVFWFSFLNDVCRLLPPAGLLSQGGGTCVFRVFAVCSSAH